MSTLRSSVGREASDQAGRQAGQGRQDIHPGEGDVEVAGETRELLRRWHDQADLSAREELVTRMLPLARSLDRFDLDREVKFATFAVPTIAGEIKRHFRDRGWMLRVPREVQELNARLSRTREVLTRDLGRGPTVDELAAGSGATVDQVVEAISAGEAYRMMSLDEPLADGVGALEAIGEHDEGFERTEQRLMLRRGFDELAPREREILRLRFFEGLTQREIADEVGISQMHVSRLIRRSVEALRDAISPPPVATAA
jgi:RNA polymerase sigma-B factor